MILFSLMMNGITIVEYWNRLWLVIVNDDEERQRATHSFSHLFVVSSRTFGGNKHEKIKQRASIEWDVSWEDVSLFLKIEHKQYQISTIILGYHKVDELHCIVHNKFRKIKIITLIPITIDTTIDTWYPRHKLSWATFVPTRRSPSPTLTSMAM